VLAAFSPGTPAVHELLIACPSLLARPGAQAWVVTLELAAPALAVEVQEAGEELKVSLRRGEAVDPALIAAGVGREWRQATEITAIEGSITLTRATGLWRAAELRVRFVVRDVQGRAQAGESQLSATLVGSPAEQVVITAPSGADPVPERVRLELERQRLLGGLAGS